LRLKEKLYLPRNAKIGSATITEQAGRWVRHVGAYEIPVEDGKGRSNTLGSRDLPKGEI
jgi:hypothetical protein